MSNVVAQAAPLLKAAGFRKRRYVFNRTTEPGLVQVVWFWMGPFEPPGPGSEKHRAAREVMGLRGDHYGTFTIRLGVYVAEMLRKDETPPADWVTIVKCHLRKPIGALLADGDDDVWWSLDRSDIAADLAIDALQTAGLPWLNRLASRDSILATYESTGRLGIGLFGWPARIAWLLKDRDRAKAEAMLRNYLQEDLSPGHRRLMEGWMRDEGFGHLLDETQG